MKKAVSSKSAEIRAQLNHPVIDCDGHMIEFEPDVLDYLKQVGGPKIVDQYVSAIAGSRLFGWDHLSPEERLDKRVARSPWWGAPTRNTLDRATATLPRLLYKRLDEFGIDFTVLFPSVGMTATYPKDEEVRRAVCRAYNTYYADLYREYADRITAAAIIPMNTPQEAVAELEYAVKELGLKVIFMQSYIRRPIPAALREAPQAVRWAFWLDTYGLDSQYDYDPVWAKCVELKVAPCFHTGATGWGSHNSISTYVYNHIGNFATAGEAVCKSLFMGGVTRRFPGLKFGFLEGGVGWACNLYADLIGHWEKRNIKALENYNPANLNREMLLDLYRRYGGRMADKLDQLGRDPLGLGAGAGVLEEAREDPPMRDEWAACRIERAEDIRDLFVNNFYFGCEADDPINAWAFNTKVNPFGARLKAIFSSDISHWDVPDMAEVVEEAYELVEKEIISEADFQDFVFGNPVSFFGGMNPEFFKATNVQAEAEKLLNRTEGGICESETE
ncbi:MAG TPA: amidohydrolase family protein [Blastocatellia bacterium]|nr:amidohydrolase family protein [Blastocatellia bacterium]